MEVNSELDEVESNVYEEKVQQRWRYKDQRQENLRANVEDNKSDVKVVPKDEKSKSLAGGRSKAIGSDAVEYGHIPDKNQPDMVAMMSKLLRQQAAPDIDISIFTGDSVDYHYFIAVFEVVEKKIDDPQGRLARLIKYTDGQPKEMIKHCIQQPAAVGYKNTRSLLEEKYGNPHQILAVYHKEIKSCPQLKPADGTLYMKFYNFLLKCESAKLGQNWNVLDTPEMMCLVLS